MILNVDNCAVVILAAGKGTRINAKIIPKVMLPMNSKPIIDYVMEAVGKSMIRRLPIVVVGFQSEVVKEHLGQNAKYVYQKQQLGTGHAVICTREILQGKVDHILTLYGDHPTIQPKMIDNIFKKHLREENKITMATVVVDDYDDWRKGIYNYGRVIRDDRGKLEEIVEVSEANKDQLKMKEVSPSYFCFDGDWLWDHAGLLVNDNQLQEYFLPDFVKIAIDEGAPVGTIKVEPFEALGVNREEELRLVEGLLRAG